MSEEENDEKQKLEQEKPSDSGRWWEYYFVRYFIGTIVGAALILMFLFADFTKPLKDSIVCLLSNPLVAGVKNVTILAASGFAYCYIASSPMLGFHALRIQLFAMLGVEPLSQSDDSNNASDVKFTWAFWIPAGILALICGGGLLRLFLFNRRESLTGLVLLSVIPVSQIVLIFFAHADEFKNVRCFYRRLARARLPVKAKEYVTSYRHMREHSNAYTIILLELLLAPSLMTAGSFRRFVHIIAIWLLPAGYCWLVGTLLEIDFALAPNLSSRRK